MPGGGGFGDMWVEQVVTTYCRTRSFSMGRVKPMNNALIKESSKMDQGSESGKMHIKLQRVVLFLQGSFTAQILYKISKAEVFASFGTWHGGRACGCDCHTWLWTHMAVD